MEKEELKPLNGGTAAASEQYVLNNKPVREMTEVEIGVAITGAQRDMGKVQEALQQNLGSLQMYASMLNILMYERERRVKSIAVAAAVPKLNG